MQRLRIAVLVAAATATAISAIPAQAQQRHSVNQAVATVSFAFLPVYVAEHMGFFAQEGVDLKSTTFATAAAGMAAVQSGDMHYYLSTPAAGARAVAGGARLTNCGALMTQNPTNIVVAAEVAKKFNIGNVNAMSVYERIGLLKGLRLAAHTPGSSPDLTLRYMLRASGMNPERDVQILPITNVGIPAALEQKRIDGFAFSSPLADQMVAQNGAVNLISFATGEFRPLANQLSITMVCNRDWVEKQTEAAAAAIRAIWRGMRLLQTDPVTARAAAMKAFPKLEPKVFDMAFEANRRAFPGTPEISRRQMEEAIEYHHATGGEKLSVRVEDTFSNLAVNRARATLKE